MRRIKVTDQLKILLLMAILFALITPAYAQSTCIPSDPPGEFPALPETIASRTGDLTEVQQVVTEDIGKVQSFALSPDGLFAVAQGEYGIHILDTGQGSILYTICLETVGLALTPDARTLVLMGEDMVQFRDVYSGEVVADIDESWTGAAFTPDGFFMVAQDTEDTLTVRDIVSQEIVYSVEDIEMFAASPAGDYLAIVTGTEVQILKLVSGELLTTLEADDIRLLTFNRSGTWLTTADDEVVTVWDMQDWQPAFEIDVQAFDISFDPLDEFIAITAEDGLGIWELESGLLIDQVACEDCVSLLAHLTGLLTADSAHLIFVEFSQ